MTSNGVGAIVAMSIIVGGRPDLAWGQADQCPRLDNTPKAVQQRAISLRNEAFKQLKQLHSKEAADLYRKAAELWPRPELHWQAGMAYAQASEVLLAYSHLSHALRCGRDVIAPTDYKAAEARMVKLQPFFAKLEVQCLQPGLSVLLDGKAWFVCPADGVGAKREVVRVGPHQVEATKVGHVDMSESVNLATGNLAVVEARLVPEEQATIATRRWATWKPWAVVGGALALSAVGAGLDWRAVSRRNDYLAAVAGMCDPDCWESVAESLLDERDRAVLENRLALGVFVASGAVLATGLTLLYLNRLQRRPNPQAGRARVRITGAVGRGAAGAALRLSF